MPVTESLARAEATHAVTDAPVAQAMRRKEHIRYAAEAEILAAAGLIRPGSTKWIHSSARIAAA